MNRLNIFLICAYVLILSACTKPQPETVQIPVGFVTSLTGAFGPYGINQKNGLELALNDLKSGSYLEGFEIVPFFRNDQSMADTCLNNFRDLIFNHQVMAIIGPTTSNSAFRADTVAQKNGLVVLGISNTVPGITGMGDFIFRNSLTEAAVIPNTVKATHAKLNYSRVAIIYGDDDPYTIGGVDAFRTAFESTTGVTIVSTETMHKGDTGFTDQLSRIKSSNPEVIVIMAFVAEASRIMVQARQLGIPSTVRFLGGNSFNTSQLWELAGEASQGAICGCAWIHSSNNPGNSAFVSNYTATYGSRPDQFAAQAYASLTILADAIKRANPLSAAALRDALSQTRNLQTILGSFSFDTNRDPVHPPIVQELVNGQFFLFQ
ncbi:MAG: ABC transporter substrate-binding protein [Bacteroidales bacterium]|jgi:branched-chain amino acid transport system substrate-binding protein